MPIAGRTIYKVRGEPKLDLGGCVLYLPLWRPDMVARGGDIVNGGGTMNVSPQALAVGANTITVTEAGTLIVNMPEGGTVASGTMAVTGSPVTVLAGIATTITTTGAIGNITVTPSNIIRSKDNNNHACSVTGAVWTSQGRSFDGLDDKIVVPHATSLSRSGDMTILAWINFSSLLTDYSQIVNKEAVNKVNYMLRFTVGSNYMLSELYDGVNNPSATSPATITSTGVWYFVEAIIKAGVTVQCFVDLAGGTAVADTSGDTTNTTDLYIGTRYTGAANEFMAGTIGEVIIYNRALSDSGRASIKQATQWRYQ